MTEPTAKQVRVATDAILSMTHENGYGVLAMDPEPPMRVAYAVVKALLAAGEMTATETLVTGR